MSKYRIRLILGYMVSSLLKKNKQTNYPSSKNECDFMIVGTSIHSAT